MWQLEVDKVNVAGWKPSCLILSAVRHARVTDTLSHSLTKSGCEDLLCDLYEVLLVRADAEMRTKSSSVTPLPTFSSMRDNPTPENREPLTPPHKCEHFITSAIQPQSDTSQLASVPDDNEGDEVDHGSAISQHDSTTGIHHRHRRGNKFACRNW